MKALEYIDRSISLWFRPTLLYLLTDLPQKEEIDMTLH